MILPIGKKMRKPLSDFIRSTASAVFKIDGLQIPTKTAEQNLRRLFDTVLEQTNYEVIFNLDATAGRRGGYHYMNEYGNIFWKTAIPIGATITLIAPCATSGCCLAMYRRRRCR